MDIPLMSSPVACGFPSPADDFIETNLNIHDFLVDHPLSTFIVQVAGDSMIEAGFEPGDYLVIDRSLPPTNGTIVIAIVNGSFSCKAFFIQNGQVILRSANQNYPPIIAEAGDEIAIWGVVTAKFSKILGKKRPTHS